MIEKLRRIPMFKVFPDQALEEFTRYLKTVDHAAGEVIFNEGDEGNSMYIIADGEVEIRKKGKTLSFLSDGDVFGEMALYEDAGRSADAVAKSDCTLYLISNDDFRKAIFTNLEPGAKFLFNSVQEMSRRLRRTSEYLITVYETGKIVGGDYNLDQMTEKILDRLIEDIAEATGGMLLLLNPFTEMYDEASNRDMASLDFEKAVGLISENEGNNIYLQSDKGIILGVPIKEVDKILGYIIVEKKGAIRPFSVEQEIIISAVGNQVGFGVLKAYNKQEEEARQRLERNRMKGY